MKLIQEDFLDLLQRHYAYNPHSPKKGVKKTAQKKMIEKFVTKNWQEIAQSKIIHTLYLKNKMVAAIYLKNEPAFYAPKVKLINLKIFVDIKTDPKIKTWCFQKINQLQKHLKANTYFALPLALAKKPDTNISSVILIGEVKKSERNLKQYYGENLKHFNVKYPNIKIVPLKTKEHVAARIRIIKKEFSRNPQFGHFCTQPVFLKMCKAELTKHAKNKSPFAFTILKGKKIVGGFHADVQKAKDNHFRVKHASVGIDLDQSIQNQGLLKYVYFILMTALLKHKVTLYSGGTSQPGVLKLSKIMQRRLLHLEVGKAKTYFKREHFKDFL